MILGGVVLLIVSHVALRSAPHSHVALRSARPRPALPRLAHQPRCLLEAPPEAEQQLVGRGRIPPFDDAKGTLLGATALVAGTTVGAGVLALPAKTLAAGFLPSSGMLFASWVYMAASGLLIAEVNVNTLCSLERDAVSITSMAAETIGEVGSNVCGVAYVFIHYALLVAYFLQGGALMLELLPSAAASGGGGLPTALGAPLFAASVGLPIALGSQQLIERVNSVLVGGVVACFGVLLFLGSQQLQPELLLHADAASVVPAIPVMVLSLVYHNVVPTICFQLGCDLPRIRTAIVAGSALPALLFVLWNGIILGAVPPEAADAARAAGEVFDPLVGLRASGGAFGDVVRIFSLLAIVTSTVGFVYGLTDFYADLLADWLPAAAAPAATTATTSGSDSDDAGANADDAGGNDDAGGEGGGGGGLLLRNAALFGLTLLPPLAVAESDPSLFFVALDYAGAFGILSLFGIIPAAMAWVQRYGPDADPVVPAALPGGKATLAVMAVGAAAVIGLEVNEKLLPLVAGLLS